jgi:hypothetical protein
MGLNYVQYTQIFAYLCSIDQKDVSLLFPFICPSIFRTGQGMLSVRYPYSRRHGLKPPYLNPERHPFGLN